MKWWIPFTFVRSLVAALLFLVWTVVNSIVAIGMIVARVPRPWVDKIITIWAEGTLLLFGVRVIEKGRENLISGSCLYIFNHTSFFDIFAMSARLKGMRFGAKIELFKIPFFGRAMKMAGVLPITRNNREKVFRVYERASAKASLGHQFALAPEGSRNVEEKLLPFKAGPFVFAINAQMPLVPVIVKGASQVLPKHGILPNWKRWFSTITLEYLPPISVQGETLENRMSLQKKAFEIMNVHFRESPTQ